MPERILKRTHNWFLVFFFGLLFFQGVLLSAHTAQAQAEVDWQDPVTTQVSTPKDTTTQAKGGTTEQAKKPTEEGCSWISNPVVCAAQYILIQIRDLFAWIASGAATMFVWAVHPDNISGPNGLLNKASLYNLWKFIRDFFNLFFILILLVSAFATIFQVESFSIRRIFFNILFAALIINFSFPITRFLIDLTNVPMYYFINVTIEGVGSGGLKITEALLGSSGVSAGIVGNPNLSILLMNIIFIFLFAISLLVLALMMMIRVLALTLLLVFSPLGFAATLLPGMQDLGRKWWSKFWSYAFFGPAAALVLLVAVRFMNEIGRDGTFRSTIDTATGMSAGAPQSVVVAQLTFFVIPIILIWTAIGMANSFSIAGATKVTGMGYGAARWTGKKLGQGAKWAGMNNSVSVRVRGAYTGAKDGLKGGKLFGAQVIPKGLSPKAFKQRSEDAEAKWKGRLKEGTGKNELAKLESKRQYEAAEEMKKNNVSNSDLEQTLQKGSNDPRTGKFIPADKVRAAAAAMVLTDRKAIQSTDDFAKAMTALGDNTKEISELIEKAGDAAMGSMDETVYKSLRSTTVAGNDVGIQKQLDARIVKEGNVKILVDHKLGGAAAPANAQQIEAAVNDVMRELKSAKDIAKQESLFNHPDYGFWAIEEIRRQTANNLDRKQAIKKASSEEGTSVGSMI